jgi:hypothetical protein
MSVGTGIFLSAVFLGGIALFIATKDRWNWRRIVLRSLLGLVTISVLVSAGIYAWVAYQEERPPKPVAITELWGLKLNTTKGDIKFYKGTPDYVHVFESKGKNEVWVYAETVEGKRIAKEGKTPPWDSYLIAFRDTEVRRISYIGWEAYKGPKLHGVTAGDSLETIVRLLGEPSYVSISEDELTRIVNYEKFNSYFELKENKVNEYGIINRKFGPAKYLKEKAR